MSKPTSMSSYALKPPSMDRGIDWNATTRSKVTTVDFLMEETEAGIAASEYELATDNLNAAMDDDAADAVYDVDAAESAFKNACEAATNGDYVLALQFSHLALLKCPPYKLNAVSKIHNLISHLKRRQPTKPCAEKSNYLSPKVSYFQFS